MNLSYMKKRMLITGVLAYSGRYIAQLAHEAGWEVLGLEGERSRHADNPLNIPITLFDWEQPTQTGRIATAMKGCDVFVNTYWKRAVTGDDAAAMAENRCLYLIEAARTAGVKRIVHLSVSHADVSSEIAYFHHKGRVEQALRRLPIPVSVLRPAVLFGDSTEESVMINNWAWCLRHSPLAGVIGDDKAQLSPIHVRDLAAMVLHEASRDDEESWHAFAAVGAERVTGRELTEALLSAMDLRRIITPMPAWIAAKSARLLRRITGGVEIFNAEELDAFTSGLLAYGDDTLPDDEVWKAFPPQHLLSKWIAEKGEELGVQLST